MGPRTLSSNADAGSSANYYTVSLRAAFKLIHCTNQVHVSALPPRYGPDAAKNMYHHVPMNNAAGEEATIGGRPQDV